MIKVKRISFAQLYGKTTVQWESIILSYKILFQNDNVQISKHSLLRLVQQSIGYKGFFYGS